MVPSVNGHLPRVSDEDYAELGLGKDFLVKKIKCKYYIPTLFFIQNKFGYACKICDTLWFEGNLKTLIHDNVEFVRTFLQNVFTSAV